MENGRVRRTAIIVTLAAAAAALGATAASSASAGTKAANPFAHYGNITLTVWSADNQDPGPEPVIKALAASFSKRYPNVKINLKFFGLTGYLKTIQLGLGGGSAPDVAEGNQGFGTDALLVKAKLIIPLDKYAAKYGWYKYFPPGTMAMFRWTPDGKTYGKGNVWGVGQFGQSVGVFYNTTKLKQYGVNPRKLPKTFSAFNSMLAQLRKKVPSSDPLIVLGNKSGYESLHDFGMVQGAYLPGTFMRNWIFHVPGSNYNTPINVKALTLFQQWFKNGYFGNDYSAVDENDAAAEFAKGKGVFYLGGNWQAQVIQAGLKGNVGFMNMPPGPSGKYVAIGATSLPWHVSTKSKYPDVGAAFINWLIAGPGMAKLSYAQNQIPAIQGALKPTGNAYLTSIANGWQQLVKANGLTLFPDWASDTMFQYMGSQFSKMMAGRLSPQDTAKGIQDNWTAFDKQLKSQ